MEAIKCQIQQFYAQVCAECGISFYIPDVKHSRCKELEENFFCPNGHNLIFTDSKVRQLEKELEQEKRRRSWAEGARDSYQKDLATERHSKAAIKGVLTKTKNRIANGVCPCCNRTFQNLASHMKQKHKGYVKEESK